MTTSGSAEFDRLRDHLMAHAEVRREVEFAFSALLTAANPSDRGLRFLFGNGAEWIMAAAAWSAGVLTAPDGHNANGFDLADLLDRSRKLWSIKASAGERASDIRLKNFMGDGAHAVWTEPTLFVAPYLEGAVLVDPAAHREVAERVRHARDALVLRARAVRDFAEQNPANRVRFEVARNQGGGPGDPHAFIKSIITPAHFPNLVRPFLAAQPATTHSRVEEITRLSALRERGELSDEQFTRMVDRIIA